MPIRVIRDRDTEQRLNEPVQRTIVIDGSTRPKSSSEPISPVRPKQDPEQQPGVTSWALVSCACTMTGKSYQLVFRREAETFVLKSIDRAMDEGDTKGTSGVDGPFNWDAFQCPECGISWTKGSNSDLPFPVLKCSCGSLFCTRKGLRMVEPAKGKGKGEGEVVWGWKCPKCGVDGEVKRALNSFSGQTLKGK